MSFQIHLNSKHADSYNNNSISDCNYYIPPIDTPNDHQINVSIQSANIPYSFFNINLSNSLSGILINLFMFIGIFASINFQNNDTILMLILIINITIYVTVYLFLKRKIGKFKF